MTPRMWRSGHRGEPAGFSTRRQGPARVPFKARPGARAQTVRSGSRGWPESGFSPLWDPWLPPSLSPWGQESCTPTPDGPTNPTFSAPHVLEPLPWTHLSPAPARRSRLPKELSSPELGATWLSPSGCHGSAGSPPPGAPSTSHWPLSGAQPRGPPAGDEALGRRARSVWRLALRFLRAQEAEVSQRAGGAAGCTPPWGARTPCPCPFRRDSPCPRGGPSPFCGYKKSVSERSWFQLVPRPFAGP